MSIPIISWFDEPAKQSVRSVFDDLNSATEALDLFKKYRREHFAAIQAALGTIKILGMSSPVRLAEIYAPTHVSTTIHRRLYEQLWTSLEAPVDHPIRRRVRTAAANMRGDKFVDSNRRVLVLGGPGSGKTTFLRFLAVAYSDQGIFKRTSLTTSRFPFFVQLVRYAEFGVDKGLFKYIADDLESRTDKYASRFVQRILTKGLGIVLLDGLDEVPSIHRAAMIQEICDFSAQFREATIVVSCRTADYRQVLEPFLEVELNKLQHSEVIKTIRAWFKDEPVLATELVRQVKKNADISTLIETPLLLSLLCIQFRHDLRLPQRKTELYRRCIEALLREWDTTRGFRRDSGYSSLDDERKMRIFELLAGKYTEEPARYVFPAQEAIEEVGRFCRRFGIKAAEGAEVVREIEGHHGILERFSVDHLMFSHPSLQEYFASRNFLAQRREMEIVRSHCHEPRWAPVIEFMSALAEDPTPMLSYLRDSSEMNIKTYPAMARRARLLWLLYRCLSGGAAVEPAVANELYKHIIDAQEKMIEVFGVGGVFPMAVLVSDGVRHSYLYYRKRQTLHEALLPLRMLANEIIASPSARYADLALLKFGEIERRGLVGEPRGFLGYGPISLASCLVTPLIAIRPKETVAVLEKLAVIPSSPLKHMIEESRRAYSAYGAA